MESAPLSYQLSTTPDLNRRYRLNKTSVVLAVAGLFLFLGLLAFTLLILMPVAHITPSGDIVPSPTTSVTNSPGTSPTALPEVLEPNNIEGL